MNAAPDGMDGMDASSLLGHGKFLHDGPANVAYRERILTFLDTALPRHPYGPTIRRSEPGSGGNHEQSA